MKNLTIIQHPLIQRDLSVLREKKTPHHIFRDTLHRISGMMAFEVTKKFSVKKFSLTTPLEKTTGFQLEKEIVLIPILRAGLGMVDGFLHNVPEARVGHIGLYRNEKTLEPVEYYSRFPKELSKSTVILIDPMLATGGSAVAAIDFLQQKGAKDITMVCLVAAPEGVKTLSRNHPKIKIFTASLDRKLNHKGYILPGLGDAGDRVFGTEL